MFLDALDWSLNSLLILRNRCTLFFNIDGISCSYQYFNFITENFKQLKQMSVFLYGGTFQLLFTKMECMFVYVQ